MTAPDITRLRALYEAATGGEWWLSGKSVVRAGAKYDDTWIGDVNWRNRTANAAFITAAHNAFPALLAAAERLARYEAAMGSEEARETVARAMCKQGGFDPDELMINDGWRWRYYVPGADAALAALARVVGE